MNQADYLSWARSEVKRSKRWRNQQNFDDDWRRYIDLYQGRQYAKEKQEDQLVINLIFSTINTMAPSVAINNPKFIVSARKPDMAPQSVIVEELLNYLWQTNLYQDEFRLSVLDWLIVGHGWVKVGYLFKKKAESKATDAADKSAQDLQDGADDDGVDDRDDVPGNTETEVTSNDDDDRPFVERISVFDMFVDPDARHPKEMRWIAQRTWRPIQDVRVDDRYETQPRKNVSATARGRYQGDDNQDGRGNDLPDKGKTYVEVIEFYDLKRKKVMTFALEGSDGDSTGADKAYLIKPADMPYAKGQPFVMLRNYEIPDCFYPLGDVSQIESLQMELNATRTQMMLHRKRFNRKWMFDKDAFDDEGVRALSSDADNVMVPVSNLQGAPLAGTVVPMPAVITPSDFYEQSSLISHDIDRVSGVSDIDRGGQTEIKRTATESAMLQDNSNSRSQDRLSKIESVLAQVGDRIIGLMQQFMTGDQTMRIVTMPGAAWVNYDKDYIQGDFDFSVSAGSTQPMNETFRRQSAMQLMDAMMPLMQAGVINPYGLAMQVLQKGFGIQDVSNILAAPQQPPAPDPATGQPQGVGGPPGGPGAPPMPPGPPGGAPPPTGMGPSMGPPV